MIVMRDSKTGSNGTLFPSFLPKKQENVETVSYAIGFTRSLRVPD